MVAKYSMLSESYCFAHSEISMCVCARSGVCVYIAVYCRENGLLFDSLFRK